MNDFATTGTATRSLRSWQPRVLDARLRTADEIALLDVREIGVFVRKHLLFAVPAPAWRLELLIGRLVPRHDTPIVVVDGDGTDVAVEAAQRLQRLGYSDVGVLDGGTEGWQAAGLELFSGDNVPSKAFGEFVEHRAGTPHIDVATLRTRLAAGEHLVIVDGRTPEEHRQFSLPGAHALPNGELALRIRELAPDPDTTVVVHCAGRTRSIIGAQTLIDAGLPNPVVALKDGTMAWLLAGHALEHGQRGELPSPSATHSALARAGAERWRQRVGVSRIDSATLQRLQDDPGRTLYRFDTRTGAEYRAGHLPGWRWAPGGQLVQATDQFVGTRGARIVLADWDGVRATTTAAWLAQMGAGEVMLYAPPGDAELEVGDETRPLRRDPALPDARWVAPGEAHDLVQAGAAVIFEVERSLTYAKRHIAGSWFAAPNRLPDWLPVHAAGRIVVVSSGDGVLGQRVASMLCAAGFDARGLLGGHDAWFAAGLPTATGRDTVLTGEEDAWYGAYAYDDPVRRQAKFREYLAWETGLPEQVARDGARPAFRYLRA